MVIEQLEKLGLTGNDARVYYALVQLGGGTGGEIIKKTGFHRNIVYEALDRLAAKRLILKTVQHKIPRYQLADPNRLVEVAEERLEAAKAVAEQIHEQAEVRSDVMLYDGVEGFRTFWRNQMSRMAVGDTYYVLGSLGDTWAELLGDDIKWFQKQFLKKKIQIRVIAYSQNQKDADFRALAAKQYQVRLMPHGYETPANAVIWQDKVALQIGVPPYTVIDIYNPVLAKSYLNTFNLLWHNAKEL